MIVCTCVKKTFVFVNGSLRQRHRDGCEWLRAEGERVHAEVMAGFRELRKQLQAIAMMTMLKHDGTFDITKSADWIALQ